MAASVEEFNKHVRSCVVVFGLLLVLTGVTVGVSYFPISVQAAVVIALIVASIKAFLVLAYFMHLISEKKIIYYTLGFSLFFFLACLILPIVTDIDLIKHTVVKTV